VTPAQLNAAFYPRLAALCKALTNARRFPRLAGLRLSFCDLHRMPSYFHKRDMRAKASQ
jgi:hypothetical protein